MKMMFITDLNCGKLNKEWAFFSGYQYFRLNKLHNEVSAASDGFSDQITEISPHENTTVFVV